MENVCVCGGGRGVEREGIKDERETNVFYYKRDVIERKETKDGRYIF